VGLMDAAGIGRPTAVSERYAAGVSADADASAAVRSSGRVTRPPPLHRLAAAAAVTVAW
jgi:hypothetical protein